MHVINMAGCLRVRQWTKNIVLFAALIFSHHAHLTSDIIRTAGAFVLFSLVSGAVYIFNDLLDIDQDRKHPIKKNRPIASGRVSITGAIYLMVIILIITIPLSFLLKTGFGVVVSMYIILQGIYTRYLKNKVILDVFVISLGFLLRVIAGALVISVEISNWILVCTMLLALFLALSKRRHELVLLNQNANDHREILKEYSPYLLDQMIGVVTSATLVAYMIFTLSEETIAKFGDNMILTVPFVLYGIFRYLYLVHTKNMGGQPEEILLSDIPLQLDVVAYGVTALIVIYF
ncbi:MAG: decaprenyl-phosphate phosphoribosyltransferase [Candidatus Latescibacteria bacterium]|nr:decaprenyl-phosphate phosphoribosyltransferase [Candidatus Latescibacterota bacterium]